MKTFSISTDAVALVPGFAKKAKTIIPKEQTNIPESNVTMPQYNIT